MVSLEYSLLLLYMHEIFTVVKPCVELTDIKLWTKPQIMEETQNLALRAIDELPSVVNDDVQGIALPAGMI